MAEFNVSIETGVVEIDGRKHITSASVARLVSYLTMAENGLATYEELMAEMKITKHTLNAYLREARRIIDLHGYQIRAVRGKGVVFEEAQVTA